MGAILLKLSGLDADRHMIPARDLAKTLEGLDRIATLFLVAVERGDVARRMPPTNMVSLEVRAPNAGSVEVGMVAQAMAAAMPFVGDFTEAVRAKLVEHFTSHVLLFFGGRRAAADEHMDKVLDILQEQLRAQGEDRQRERAAVYADREGERAHLERVLRMQAEILKPDAVKVVTPLGRSCSNIQFGDQEDDDLELDEATAEAVRAKRELIVSDVLEMDFDVDGLSLSKKALIVSDPERPAKKINAYIVDPTFDPTVAGENPYDTAVKERRRIRLTGRVTRQPDGRIKYFHAIAGSLL